jgi:predicted nuclease of predicted toxin-antitoxin system
VLYLDEDISGKKFATLLEQAHIPTRQYETLLVRNKKIADSKVIEVASAAGFVIVTADKRMEAEWIEDIIIHKSKSSDLLMTMVVRSIGPQL